MGLDASIGKGAKLVRMDENSKFWRKKIAPSNYLPGAIDVNNQY